MSGKAECKEKLPMVRFALTGKVKALSFVKMLHPNPPDDAGDKGKEVGLGLIRNEGLIEDQSMQIG